MRHGRAFPWNSSDTTLIEKSRQRGATQLEAQTAKIYMEGVAMVIRTSLSVTTPHDPHRRMMPMLPGIIGDLEQRGLQQLSELSTSAHG